MRADLILGSTLQHRGDIWPTEVSDTQTRIAVDRIIIDCFMNQAAKALENRHVEKQKGFESVSYLAHTSVCHNHSKMFTDEGG